MSEKLPPQKNPPKLYGDEAEIEKMWAECAKSERWRLRWMWLKSFWVAIRDRCEESLSGWRHRTFYTLKVLICLALGRSYKPRKGDKWGNSYQNHTVGWLWYEPSGIGWNAELLCVGDGAWKNWWYLIESDGDCYL